MLTAPRLEAVPASTALAPMPRAQRRLLWLALGIALAVRLLTLALVEPAPVRSDPSGYDATARRLLATGTFAFPVGDDLWADDAFREDAWRAYLERPSNAWTMPGYPFFVAGIYRLFGDGPERFRAVYVAQALLGAITVAIGFWIARQTVGARAAWFALGLATLYPPSLWVTGYLLTETLFTALFVAQVALLIVAARSERLLPAALLGVITAAAILVRPVAAIVPIVLGGIEGYRLVRASPRPAFGPALARLAMLGATVALLLAPWVIRNARVYHVFMPATSAAGFPGLQGDLTLRGLPVPMATYAQSARPGLTGHDDHRYARWILAQVEAYAPRPTPWERVQLQFARARMLAGALTTPFRHSVPEYPILSGAFAMQSTLLALAGLGLLRLRRNRLSLAILAGVSVGYLFAYWRLSALWPRFLYPLMPLMLVLAAGGALAVREWMPPAARALPAGPTKRDAPRSS